ncbi:DUF4279 domain-containing protein [Loktanella sp. F6476L]|uniref:DUF4279 domain-containing protein n=1 Tax=Loktanella sp. F6476L TaxID=2926405 RepID=UPI001FF1AD3F|nr:DUF4279 domain-containing protein [Loktanella sp. F6476L]
MPRPASTKAALRIWGDDLVPDEISKLLGTTPTSSERKGEDLRGKKSRYQGFARTGGWRFVVAESGGDNLDAQITYLFAQLTSDLDVWSDLAAKYKIDVFCGVFMQTGNDGLDFNATTLRLLGDRGARLDLDIYGSLDR